MYYIKMDSNPSYAVVDKDTIKMDTNLAYMLWLSCCDEQ